jgi:RND family efflux transporter MFP subunit
VYVYEDFLMTHCLPRLVPLLGVTLLLSSCGNAEPLVASVEAPARPAKIVTVAVDSSELRRTFPGTLHSTRHSELAFRVSGQLVELPAQAGIRVQRGQLLGRLDDADFRNQLADREARFQLAKTQHAKVAKLIDKRYTTQADLDEAVANLKAARAALELARDNLDYTELRAPFDGVVGHVAVENHQAVKAQTPVLQLQSDAGLDVVFSVPESLLTSLRRIDDPSQICVKVRFNARPKKVYRACYKEHDSLPDPLTRTYTVVHTMAAIEDFPVLPGMAVNVEVDLSKLLPEGPRTGVRVPLGAIFEEGGKRWAWRLDEEMRVRRTEVQTGDIRGESLRVINGLVAGDRIIAAGVSRLREGMQVRPLVKERGL